MANLVKGKQIAIGADGIGAANVNTAEVPTLAANNLFTGDNTISGAGSLTVNGTLTVTGGGSNITVPTPTSGSQAANKSYVDSVASGLEWKDAARAGTTAAIANLTSVSTTMDGVTLVAGDRVLVMNGASRDGIEAVSHAHDGIYVVGTVTSGHAPLTRAADANTGTPNMAGSMVSGTAVFVTDGTANGGNGWVLVTDNPITLDTTLLNFVQFTGTGDVLPGAGLSKTGNTIFVSNASSGNLLIGQGLSSSTTFNAMSGDATIDNTGSLTISAAAVTGGAGGKLAANTVDGTNLFKGTSGYLLVGQGASNTAYVAMSGDATIDNSGNLTISNGAITSAKIGSATITGANIASNTITGSNMVNNTVTGTQLFKGTAGALLMGQGGSNSSYVVMSGDATISSGGTLTISANAITASDINTSAVGNGLTGGGGTPLAVVAQDNSIHVSASGIEAAVPSGNNKAMSGSVTAADGDLACSTAVTATPAGSEYVSVVLNGVEVTVGNGSTTSSACYFSADSGVTAKAFGSVASGDLLYWVGSVAGYQIDATDTISFLYNV